MTVDQEACEAADQAHVRFNESRAGAAATGKSHGVGTLRCERDIPIRVPFKRVAEYCVATHRAPLTNTPKKSITTLGRLAIDEVWRQRSVTPFALPRWGATHDSPPGGCAGVDLLAEEASDTVVLAFFTASSDWPCCGT